MTVQIRLPQGKFALIDECDFDMVSMFSWWIMPAGHTEYATTEIMRKGVKTRFRMHRLILRPRDDQDVDHANKNGLDNRRCNIRIATRSQNSANRSNNRKGGYRGVYPSSTAGLYEVRLSIRPKCHYLGRFKCPVEAARVYDAAALAAFGEFATLNFPGADRHVEHPNLHRLTLELAGG